MKKTIVTVKGYTLNPYKNFEDNFVVYSASDLLDLRAILQADGVHIEDIFDNETGEHFFTAGEVEAMGHGIFDKRTSSKMVFVYKAENGLLHYSRMF